MSGDIEAQGIGGRIGFNSVSGDLTLADGSVDRLDAKTVSGRVTADIDLDRDAAAAGGTVSGAVAIRLPAETERPGGAAVRGRAGAERVRAACSPSQQPGASTLSGQLGGGDGVGKLSVSTMSGQVTLLQRDEPGRVRQAASTPGGSR